MPDDRECSIAYFISLTHCQREQAIEILEKTKWKLDESLNLYFENYYRTEIHSKSIDGPSQQYDTRTTARSFDLVPLVPRSPSNTIVIPALIEFNRFMESFHLNATVLLENSSKMVNLAIKYAALKPEIIPCNRKEDWTLHLETDHRRLRALIDNEMCAPLVWIEHFEHLLNGDPDQLFDCDYMFTVIDDQEKIDRSA